MGSIPIARSKTPIDSNTLTGQNALETTVTEPNFGRGWTQHCTKTVLDAKSALSRLFKIPYEPEQKADKQEKQ